MFHRSMYIVYILTQAHIPSVWMISHPCKGLTGSQDWGGSCETQLDCVECLIVLPASVNICWYMHILSLPWQTAKSNDKNKYLLGLFRVAICVLYWTSVRLIGRINDNIENKCTVKHKWPQFKLLIDSVILKQLSRQTSPSFVPYLAHHSSS